ncbi:histidine phosphatase family protein [Roseburia hominis]
MELILIRHFKTEGNLKGRYIGVTDEPLDLSVLPEKTKRYPEAEAVVVSPMKRCIQTAERIYPGLPYVVCDELRECDFGEFEGKNCEELSGNPMYQKWIDSGGTLPFPGGEGQASFRERCVRGFERMLCEMARQEIGRVAFVVHGGTIMAVLSAFDKDGQGFYHWQVGNGEGFYLAVSEEKWLRGEGYFEEGKNLWRI